MAESPEAKKTRARKIIKILEREYPDAGIALRFTNPLELLVATILAAQCTDERVNMVTKSLFQKYRTARDYARADPETLEREVHSTGFYKAKARAILKMAKVLDETYGGKVPRSLEDLVALPGVGRKTANVVLGNAYGQQAIAVDTHVFRVSQRLGLANSHDPEVVHDQLCEVLPRPKWTPLTHLLTTHGRRVCHARAPSCLACPARVLCPWHEKTAQ
jgi:endonuclease-3